MAFVFSFLLVVCAVFPPSAWQRISLEKSHKHTLTRAYQIIYKEKKTNASRCMTRTNEREKNRKEKLKWKLYISLHV